LRQIVIAVAEHVVPRPAREDRHDLGSADVAAVKDLFDFVLSKQVGRPTRARQMPVRVAHYPDSHRAKPLFRCGASIWLALAACPPVVFNGGKTLADKPPVPPDRPYHVDSSSTCRESRCGLVWSWTIER